MPKHVVTENTAPLRSFKTARVPLDRNQPTRLPSLTARRRVTLVSDRELLIGQANSVQTEGFRLLQNTYLTLDLDDTGKIWVYSSRAAVLTILVE